jgi:hypothetical protein
VVPVWRKTGTHITPRRKGKHMRRTLSFVAVVTALLAACVPPPPQPPTLPGDLSFHGQQQLTFTVVDNDGDVVFECHLTHDAIYDLGYTTVRITAKLASSGCPRSDWLGVSAVARCTVGGTLDCGHGWVLPAGVTYKPLPFTFLRSPHLGIITTRLAGQFRLGTPASVEGSTPQIRCSTQLRQCKFQT